MKMVLKTLLCLLQLHHAAGLVVHGSKAESEANAQPLVVNFTVQKGVLRCTDSNKGKGFIMYSGQEVNKRWNTDPYQLDFRGQTSSNLVCVRYNKGRWEYDANWADEPDRGSKESWHYFMPTLQDVLVARVDFSNGNKITSLKGMKFRHNGMNAGYAAGKLLIGKIKGGFATSGGSIFPYPDTVAFVPPKPPIPQPAVPSNKLLFNAGGFRCTDGNTGKGFLMYSKQPVNDRWKKDKFQADFRQHTASNFVCVRYNRGRWEYDTNWADEKDRASKRSWHKFWPLNTDVIVASVDYVSMKLKDLKGMNFKHSGMQMGYSAGDLQFFPNQGVRGKLDYGEFKVNGTFVVDYNYPKAPMHINNFRVPLHDEATSFSCSSNANAKAGFVMLANATILKRFNINLTAEPTAVSQRNHKFLCVQYNHSKWLYDANWRKKPSWVEFVPDPSDIVVASINYTTGEIKRIEGTNVRYSGMQMGFAGGDLWVFTTKQSVGDIAKQRRKFRVSGDVLRVYSKYAHAIPPVGPPTTTTTTTTTTLPDPYSTTTQVLAFFTTEMADVQYIVR
eukprot:TRINITY_DN1377_c0_g1_i1.p1 TRINITY_DN1377_c0_g1~~TRINITY_DN1377_c0_g1_i1.p1  ORF type:complete len:559 (-),score=86.48 TRINITY_DN1377_c0_g1_i1:115-1791(-)